MELVTGPSGGSGQAIARTLDARVRVTSLLARSGSAMAQVLPSFAAACNRIGGAKQIAAKLAIAHEEKR